MVLSSGISLTSGGRHHPAAAAPHRRSKAAAWEERRRGTSTSTTSSRRDRRRGDVLPRRTSEHWYDDELEYDAVREILDPKRVVIAAVGADAASLAARLPKLDYAVGFCSEGAAEAAAEVWSALGRGGPPLFLRVRKRAALTELDAAAAAGQAPPGASPSASEAFWEELAAQNWRTELDYGLGSGYEGAASSTPPREEPVLVLVEREESARVLAEAASAAAAAAAEWGRAAGAFYYEVCLKGWNQEPDPEKHRPLGEWRELLLL